MILLDCYAPLEYKSGNHCNNRRTRAAQFAYKNYRDKWSEHLKLFAKLPPVFCQEFRYGLYIRIMSKYQRRYDKNNLYAGSKPMQDWLQDAGWLVNDNPKWHEYDCEQIKDPCGSGYPGTRIILFTEKEEVTEYNITFCPRCYTLEVTKNIYLTNESVYKCSKCKIIFRGE